MRRIAVFALLGLLAAASSAFAGAQRVSPVNLWVVWDANAHHEPLEDMFDCLINHTDFNDIIATYADSPYKATPLLWDPSQGHGGSTTVAAGSCGVLYGPNPQCLVSAVMNDPKLGTPMDGDIFLYIVADHCGGGNNNGGSNGLSVFGTAVNGPGGATIHVLAGTIGDGSADHNYFICQQRVAVHEAFEAATDVSAADCCTGQTPGNFCEMCDPSCSRYLGYGDAGANGPAGWGSYYISCNGQQYVSQIVTAWSGDGSEWVTSSCREAVAKEPPQDMAQAPLDLGVTDGSVPPKPHKKRGCDFAPAPGDDFSSVMVALAAALALALHRLSAGSRSGRRTTE